MIPALFWIVAFLLAYAYAGYGLMLLVLARLRREPGVDDNRFEAQDPQVGFVIIPCVAKGLSGGWTLYTDLIGWAHAGGMR